MRRKEMDNFEDKRRVIAEADILSSEVLVLGNYVRDLDALINSAPEEIEMRIDCSFDLAPSKTLYLNLDLIPDYNSVLLVLQKAYSRELETKKKLFDTISIKVDA
jgi:RNAse (barnase) inhibitor barstar